MSCCYRKEPNHNGAQEARKEDGKSHGGRTDKSWDWVGEEGKKCRLKETLISLTTDGQFYMGKYNVQARAVHWKTQRKLRRVQIHKMIKVFMQTQLLKTWKGCGGRQKSEGKKQPTHRVIANLKEGSLERVWWLVRRLHGQLHTRLRCYLHFVNTDALTFTDECVALWLLIWTFTNKGSH